MLTVTMAAKEYLVGLKAKANLAHRDMALRIVAGPLGQLGLLLDVQRADDHVIEHEGAKALLVGREAAKPLASAVIDARPNGVGLVLRRLGRFRRARDGMREEG
jgi:hypothetical protein